MEWFVDTGGSWAFRHGGTGKGNATLGVGAPVALYLQQHFPHLQSIVVNEPLTGGVHSLVSATGEAKPRFPTAHATAECVMQKHTHPPVLLFEQRVADFLQHFNRPQSEGGFGHFGRSVGLIRLSAHGNNLADWGLQQEVSYFTRNMKQGVMLIEHFKVRICVCSWPCKS